MHLTLRGARLVDARIDMSMGDITLQGGHIREVGQVREGGASEVVDATGAIITPGFIDVHTHGGGGFNLHTTDVEEIRSYARWVPTTGVTSFLVAVVGTPHALPEPQLRTAVTAVEENISEPGAQPLGIYLEGPYISEKRRGAHLPAWLRLPAEEETERILALTEGRLKLITLAPELPGAQQMTHRLLEAGARVSIGHTDADYEQTREAIQWGATQVTHCFNAMRPLLHREPGPLAAIAQARQVSGELIADGVHVHPAMMDMLVRMLGAERLIVITDAQAGAGLEEAEFEFGGQQARICCGAVRLLDGSLAGSILTLEQALRNMLDFTHLSLSQAVATLTLNPARSAQVEQSKGLLQAGHDADLVLFSNDLKLQATICRGRLAFANAEWRSKLKSLA